MRLSKIIKDLILICLCLLETHLSMQVLLIIYHVGLHLCMASVQASLLLKEYTKVHC